MKLRCFINTGTQVSTVTETFYRQDLDKLESMNVGELIRITAVNGLDIPYIGDVTLNVKVFGQQVDNLGFLVFKDVADPVMCQRKMFVLVVLGSNALRGIKLTVDRNSHCEQRC